MAVKEFAIEAQLCFLCSVSTLAHAIASEEFFKLFLTKDLASCCFWLQTRGDFRKWGGGGRLTCKLSDLHLQLF